MSQLILRQSGKQATLLVSFFSPRSFAGLRLCKPTSILRRAASLSSSSSSSSSSFGRNSTASARSDSSFAYASSSKSGSPSFIQSKELFNKYQSAQRKRPYMTQVWSFVGLWLVGDLTAQFFFPAQKIDETTGELKRVPYDGWKTLRHLFIATTVAIPTYRWFLLISRNFNYHGHKVLSLAIKVAVQQAVYAPVFNLYFFGMHSLLSGASWAETAEHLKRALPKSISNGIGVWTAAAVVNFTAVPAPFQGLFMGLTAVGWQVYLSWLNQTLALKKAAESK